MSEQWRDVDGTDGAYQVSNLGQIWSNKTGKILKPKSNKHDKYLRISLRIGGKTIDYLIHRLVLEAFTGPPPRGTEGCHRNGDPTDNRSTNLRWGTPSSNQNDRRAHGTISVNTGEDHPQAYLTEEKVRHIKSLLAERIKHTDIAAMVGTSRANVANISSNRIWRHV